MEYKEIVAVTGIGGLFQLITTKSDGAIVRNLTDKSTKFIPARVHNVTPIESIEIYTVDENVRLHIVLQAIKESEATTPLVNHQKADNSTIKNYFKTVFPALDEERVYVSDMKKILKWYQLLKENNLLNFEASKDQETPEAEATSEAIELNDDSSNKGEKSESADVAEKPAKKAKAKKAIEEISSDEAPAKKTARKKKTEE